MADYNIDEIVRLVKAALLAESQGVGELPVVTSLDGIESLPALKDGNNVVEVPIDLLSEPAKKAAEDAYKAIEEVNKAVKEAGSATSSANNAASNANNAAATANSATNATVAAISKANAAADNANAAADRANAVVGSGGSMMYVTLAEYLSMWASGAIQENIFYVVGKHSIRAFYAGITKIYPPASGTLLSDGVFRFDNVFDEEANVSIK